MAELYKTAGEALREVISRSRGTTEPSLKKSPALYQTPKFDYDIPETPITDRIVDNVLNDTTITSEPEIEEPQILLTETNKIDDFDLSNLRPSEGYEATTLYYSKQKPKPAEIKEKDNPGFKVITDFASGMQEGFINSIVTAGTGLSALLSEDAEKKALEKLNKFSDMFAPDPDDPDYEQTKARKLGNAISSVLAFVIPGGAAKIAASAINAGVKASAMLGYGATGSFASAIGAGEARQRAISNKANSEQIREATWKGAIVGLSELAPIQRYFRILKRTEVGQNEIRKIQSIGKDAFITGGVEGLQEAAAGVAQNYIAKSIYKPDQQLIEGVGEEAAYGGAAGAIIQVVGDLMLNGIKKGRAAPPLTPTTTDPEKNIVKDIDVSENQNPVVEADQNPMNPLVETLEQDNNFELFTDQNNKKVKVNKLIYTLGVNDMFLDEQINENQSLIDDKTFIGDEKTEAQEKIKFYNKQKKVIKEYIDRRSGAAEQFQLIKSENIKDLSIVKRSLNQVDEIQLDNTIIAVAKLNKKALQESKTGFNPLNEEVDKYKRQADISREATEQGNTPFLSKNKIEQFDSLKTAEKFYKGMSKYEITETSGTTKQLKEINSFQILNRDIKKYKTLDDKKKYTEKDVNEVILNYNNKILNFINDPVQLKTTDYADKAEQYVKPSDITFEIDERYDKTEPRTKQEITNNAKIALDKIKTNRIELEVSKNITKAEANIINIGKKYFKSDIVFYDDSVNTNDANGFYAAEKDKDGFNLIALKRQKSEVGLEMRYFAHELVHLIKNRRPDIYNELEKTLQGTALKYKFKDKTRPVEKEETVAGIIEEYGKSQIFWQSIFKDIKDKSIVQQLFNYIKRIINTIKGENVLDEEVFKAVSRAFRRYVIAQKEDVAVEIATTLVDDDDKPKKDRKITKALKKDDDPTSEGASILIRYAAKNEGDKSIKKYKKKQNEDKGKINNVVNEKAIEDANSDLKNKKPVERDLSPEWISFKEDMKLYARSLRREEYNRRQQGELFELKKNYDKSIDQILVKGPSEYNPKTKVTTTINDKFIKELKGLKDYLEGKNLQLTELYETSDYIERFRQIFYLKDGTPIYDVVLKNIDQKMARDNTADIRVEIPVEESDDVAETKVEQEQSEKKVEKEVRFLNGDELKFISQKIQTFNTKPEEFFKDLKIKKTPFLIKATLDNISSTIKIEQDAASIRFKNKKKEEAEKKEKKEDVVDEGPKNETELKAVQKQIELDTVSSLLLDTEFIENLEKTISEYQAAVAGAISKNMKKSNFSDVKIFIARFNQIKNLFKNKKSVQKQFAQIYAKGVWPILNYIKAVNKAANQLPGKVNIVDMLLETADEIQALREGNIYSPEEKKSILKLLAMQKKQPVAQANTMVGLVQEKVFTFQQLKKFLNKNDQQVPKKYFELFNFRFIHYPTYKKYLENSSEYSIGDPAAEMQERYRYYEHILIYKNYIKSLPISERAKQDIDLDEIFPDKKNKGLYLDYEQNRQDKIQRLNVISKDLTEAGRKSKELTKTSRKENEKDFFGHYIFSKISLSDINNYKEKSVTDKDKEKILKQITQDGKEEARLEWFHQLKHAVEQSIPFLTRERDFIEEGGIQNREEIKEALNDDIVIVRKLLKDGDGILTNEDKKAFIKWYQNYNQKAFGAKKTKEMMKAQEKNLGAMGFDETAQKVFDELYKEFYKAHENHPLIRSKVLKDLEYLKTEMRKEDVIRDQLRTIEKLNKKRLRGKVYIEGLKEKKIENYKSYILNGIIAKELSRTSSMKVTPQKLVDLKKRLQAEKRKPAYIYRKLFDLYFNSIKVFNLDRTEGTDFMFKLGNLDSNIDPSFNAKYIQAEVLKITSAMKSPPPIEVLPDITYLPKDVQNQVPEGTIAKGIFDANKGIVYLISNNIKSQSDLEFTLFHEMYGHYGLRTLLGKNFDSFLNTQYRINKTIRNAVDKRIKNEGLSKLEAIDEVLADMAETAKAPNFYRSLIATIVKALRSINFNGVADYLLTLTTTDAVDYLAVARKYVDITSAESAFLGEPNSIRFSKRPKPIALYVYKNKQLKSIIVNHALTNDIYEFKSNEGEDIRSGNYHKIRNTSSMEDIIDKYQQEGFSVKQRGYTPYYKGSKGNLVRVPTDFIDYDNVRKNTSKIREFWHNFVYQVQNQHAPVFEVIKFLEDTKGKSDVLTRTKQSLLTNESIAAQDTAKFTNEYVNPLLETIKLLGNKKEDKGYGISFENIEKIALAFHSKERNKQIAKINNKEYTDDTYTGSGMSFNVAKKFLRKNYNINLALDPETNEFKISLDLSSVEQDLASGKIKEDQAQQQEVFITNRAILINRYIKQLQNISRYKLRYLKETGLLSTEQKRSLENYKYYINLSGGKTKREADNIIPEVKKTISAVKRAKTGLTATPDDIILNTIASVQSAIVIGQKNIVKQNLLNIFENYNDPDSFEIQQFRTKTELDEYGYINIIEQDKLDQLKDSSTIGIKVDGRLYLMKIAKDEGIFKTLRESVVGTPVKEGLLADFLRFNQSFTRGLSQLITTYNPAFTIVNAIRDAQTALINISADPKLKIYKGIRKDFIKNYPSGYMMGLIYSYEDKINSTKLGDKELAKTLGKGLSLLGIDVNKILDTKTFDGSRREVSLKEDYLLFKSFMETGGLTQFLDRKGLDSRLRDLKSSLRPIGKQEGFAGMVSKLKQTSLGNNIVTRTAFSGVSMIETLSTMSEIAPRFAVFKTLMKKNLPEFNVKSAAVYAKELTTNFNMKGKAEPFRQMYMFFNPAVQGTERMFRDAGSKSWAKTAGSVVLIGVLANILFRSLDSDEETEYDELSVIPHYKRNTSILLGPEGAAIPIAYGWNMFYSFGNYLYDVVMGNMSIKDASGNVAQTAVEAFMPMAGAFERESTAGKIAGTIAPSSFHGLIGLALNENRWGSPISKDDLFGKTADANKGYDSANPISVSATKLLNESFGGNPYESSGFLTDFSPGSIDFLINTYLPGVIGNTYNYFGKSLRVSRDEIKEEKLPGGGGLYGILVGNRFTTRIEPEWVAGAYRRLQDKGVPAFRAAKAGIDLNRLNKSDIELGAAIEKLNGRIKQLQERKNEFKRQQNISSYTPVREINEAILELKSAIVYLALRGGYRSTVYD